MKTRKRKPIKDKIINIHMSRYNEPFIELLDKLYEIMVKRGEPFRAKAYQKAQEALIMYPDDITSVEQIKDVNGIGKSIMEKFDEYLETGTLQIIEAEKTNPLSILANVYGIGPKKAQELVDAGITTIADLREKQDKFLNATQKIGLKYYEQFLERIPRAEIEEYYSLFKDSADEPFEIVGSYRRGLATSGDIDVIVN